jgi:lipopolysaccharide transport system ATP-binding protein
MSTVISIEHLSKAYRLGQIGTGTLTNDLKIWWARVRGKPNPLLKIGQQDHGNQDGETIWALRDVSFTVEQGEVLGIIGRNGAGKSTLLKILSRVTAPSSGVVKVKGRIASLLEVGTGFHPELTGHENIYLNGAILGMSRKEIDRKFDEIVAFSEVEKFIDTPVKRYSSGMYVRLAFAVAAHLDPEILIVDEVLAVGDAEFQKKCLGKMGDVAKEGRTVLFVSHNMAAIQNLCPKTVIMEKGCKQGPMSTLRAIRQYLGVEKLNEYRGSWNNPSISNNSLLVKSIFLLQTEKETDIVKMSLPFQIKFNLTFAAMKKDCALAIHINDENGDVIYHSMDIFNDKPSRDSQSSGDRIAQIPAYGLASGDYWLSYWLGNFHEGVWDHSPDVLHWRVQADSPMMMVIPESEWKGKVGPGLIRWEIIGRDNVHI